MITISKIDKKHFSIYFCNLLKFLSAYPKSISINIEYTSIYNFFFQSNFSTFFKIIAYIMKIMTMILLYYKKFYLFIS